MNALANGGRAAKGMGIAIALALLGGCSPSGGVDAQMTPQEFGIEALEFFDQGMYAEGAAYEKSRTAALERIEEAETFAEVKRVLRGQLTLAGGRHSRMVPAGGDFLTDPRRPTATVEGGILYLTIPGFASDDDNEGREYAMVSAEALATPGICGVVVDLRENNGGDMGPMIGGLTALLPEGVFQTVVFPRDDTRPEIERRLEDGKMISDEEGVLWESVHDLVLEPVPPVAVLISGETASAGELTALSFAGVEHARLFGQPTMGLVSGPLPKTVYDTEFAVAVAAFRDRTGQLYSDTRIVPDVAVRTSQARAAATEWLRSEGCA